MNEQQPRITEQDLHAYVDGRLESARCEAVEAYLRESDEARERTADYRQINQALHSLFDPVLQESVPLHLGNTARRPRSYPRLGLQAAAMLATLVIGAIGGWFGHSGYNSGQAEIGSLFGNAYMAHVVYTPEVRHPVEVAAEQEQHLVTWLSKRLQAPVRAPVLAELGYRLLGGRLLASEGEPAAQFMYENPQGNRLTLYIRRNRQQAGDTAFRFERNNDVQGFYWIDGELGYALIGEADRDLIYRAAHRVYEQLGLR